MFLLVAIGLAVLGGAFVAGVLSRLTKARPVTFTPKAVERRRVELSDEPKVWDQNLLDAAQAKKQVAFRQERDKSTMGNWD
jgi:hypothetical protein